MLIAIAALASPLAADRDDGLDNRLHAANDAEHRIDVYDVDQDHKLLRSITPRLNGRDLLDSRRFSGFSSGIRPFAVDPSETYVFANLTKLLGFGVGDVRAGRKLYEVEQQTPAERVKYPEASGGHPHGGSPKSHGLAMRPGTNEVWFLDDEWGYLYVYDASPLPASAPKHVAPSSMPNAAR